VTDLTTHHLPRDDPRRLYRVVLVPTDGSDASRHAFPLAVAIAKPSGATVHVVEVMEADADVAIYGVPIAGGGLSGAHLVDTGATDGNAVRSVAQNELEALAARLAAQAGVATRAAVVEGTVVETLARYASANAVDLVVMSTHGRTGIGRAMLGSVSDALVRSVECPVLLARPHATEVAEGEPQRITHVLAPLDGSPEGDTVVRHVTEVAALTGARCTLLHVTHPEVMSGVAAPLALLDPEGRARDRDDAKAHLDRYADLLRDRSILTTTVVLGGKDPGAAILEYAGANAVDLIALTTHARHGIGRLMLGSTASLLLRQTRLPLLLLRADISSGESHQRD
jgi:nucleotide-binding universal stress UspA family protein